MKFDWQITSSVSSHNNDESNVCKKRKDVTIGSINPTSRIPYSYYYYYYSCVTKSVKWRYLGNQAWYHRSAGVKTTRKILGISKLKKKKKFGKKKK